MPPPKDHISSRLPQLSVDYEFDTSDMVNGMYPSSINPDIGMPGAPILVGGINVLGGTSGRIVTLTKNMGGNKITGRMSWREIIRE